MIGRVISNLLPVGFDVTAGTLRFRDESLFVDDARPPARAAGRSYRLRSAGSLSRAFNPGGAPPRHSTNSLTSTSPGLALPRAQQRERAIARLEAVRLPHPAEILGKYSFHLSGGMCQRVLIALAFASNPALLVADEPTTALDVITQAHIIELIRDLNRQFNAGIIFITHDLQSTCGPALR